MTYPGGKNGAGVYQQIINLMPPHDVYIEPFLGGAAILRLKRPAGRSIACDLVAPSELAIEACIGSPGESGSDTARTGENGRYRQDRRESIDNPAIATRQDRRGPPTPFARSSEARGNRQDRRGEIFTTSNGIPFEFHQTDGIEFLRTYKFTGRELVYCDPPYLLSTRTKRRLYQFEMPDREHRRLLRCIRKIPAAVLISGYPSPMYAEALRDWNRIEFQAMTRGGTPRTESVWYNYATPEALHDYQYLGEGFRERERIKRKTLRWTARLKRMPTLEKQALLCAIATVAETAGSRAAAGDRARYLPDSRRSQPESIATR